MPHLIQVGTLVIAKRQTGVCDPGEIGVCYDVYTLAGRPGYGFIFASGRYDRFSPEEVERILTVTALRCPRVAAYHFTNVARLGWDFQRGWFHEAFTKLQPPRGEHHARQTSEDAHPQTGSRPVLSQVFV